MAVKVDLAKFVKLVIQSLEESRIRYVIVGGIAAILYGRPRTTLDIDIVISQANLADITRLEQTLKKNGFSISDNEILEAVNQKSHCSIFFKDYVYRIEIHGVYNPLNDRCLKNRLLMKVFEQKAYVQKAEDLIIAKLIYNSQQDLEDAFAILKRQQSTLDRTYLRKIATLEGLGEQLDKFLTDIDSIS